MRRAFLFASVVIMMALALSSALWWAFASPAANGLVPFALLRAFAAPVGVVGWVMSRGAPHSLSALVGSCDFCTPRRHFVHFLEVAVPAYCVLFGVLALLVTGRKPRIVSK